MAKIKRATVQTMADKTLHREIKIEPHESYWKVGWIQVPRKGTQCSCSTIGPRRAPLVTNLEMNKEKKRTQLWLW